VIRIDIHPAGKNPTNTPCTLPTLVNARPTYAFYGQSPYVTTFHWLPRSKDRLTQPSSWVASFFLPCDNPRVGERGFGPIVTQLHQLTGPISPACDQYIQYLLTGVNPSVLNRHRRGLEPWSYQLATYPLPDLPN
jgi:hypothetical protein